MVFLSIYSLLFARKCLILQAKYNKEYGRESKRETYSEEFWSYK